jgi:hypothetical protein
MGREVDDLVNEIRSKGTLVERLDQCRQIIVKLCSQNRRPKMSIPVSSDDEDMFMIVTLADAIKELNVLKIGDRVKVIKWEIYNGEIGTVVSTYRPVARYMKPGFDILSIIGVSLDCGILLETGDFTCFEKLVRREDVINSNSRENT